MSPFSWDVDDGRRHYFKVTRRCGDSLPVLREEQNKSACRGVVQGLEVLRIVEVRRNIDAEERKDRENFLHANNNHKDTSCDV